MYCVEVLSGIFRINGIIWKMPDRDVLRSTWQPEVVTHRYFFNENTLLKTTLAGTYSDQEAIQTTYDREFNPSPNIDQNSRSTNLILTSSLNRKVNKQKKKKKKKKKKINIS